MNDRERVVKELHTAYLSGKLGSVCDQILAEASGPIHPSVNGIEQPLTFDPVAIHRMVSLARFNSKAWVAVPIRWLRLGPGSNRRTRKCRSCGSEINPTNKRGRPRLRCAPCGGA